MRVFVAGASGAIGSRLVPQLIERGHEVIGTSRSAGNAERLRALGAEPIVLDLLDPRAVRKAVLKVAPDAIIHQATALANARFSRNMDRTFASTIRLRTEGTDALLAAAREAGVSRFGFIARVYRENTFTSATIEVAEGQRVISTGPYSFVRHPMYASALLYLVATPLALGSYWGGLAFVFMLPFLLWRLVDEERLLARDLPGYTDYQKCVRYRLVPLLW